MNGTTRKKLFLLWLLLGLGICGQTSSALASASEFVFDPIRSTVFCLISGEDEGRVIVDISVRYSVQSKLAHRPRFVGATVVIRDDVGNIIAKLKNTEMRRVLGKRLMSIRHVHRMRLGDVQGDALKRYAFGGPECKGTSKKLFLVVTANNGFGKLAVVHKLLANDSMAIGGPAPNSAANHIVSSIRVHPVSAVPPVVDGCKLEPNTTCISSDLENTNMSGLDLSSSEFIAVTFNKVIAVGTNFENTKFAAVSVNNSAFNLANFNNGTLAVFYGEGNDFSNATMNSINTKKFKRPFDVVKLDSPNSTYLDTDLTGSNLPNTNFVGSAFGGANFTNVNLAGADFTGAMVKNMIVSGATCSNSTLWSTGAPNHGSPSCNPY